MKELKESISGAQLDAGDLEQQAQHLKRQLATLSDRIKRLESQVGVRRSLLRLDYAEHVLCASRCHCCCAINMINILLCLVCSALCPLALTKSCTCMLQAYASH